MNPILCLAAILSMATSTAPQAPQSAGMWRVGVATASRAATSGPAPGTLRAGIQVLHPSDAVGLTGILDGIKRPGPTYRLTLDVDIVQ